jgi:hypothetical protein
MNSLDDWLNNPIFQAGVGPFLVSLMLAALLLNTRLLGLAIGSGFAVGVALTIGFSFQSMSSVNKLIVVGLAAAGLVLILEMTGMARNVAVGSAISGVAGIASVWVVWRVLQQQELPSAVLKGVLAALYLGLLVESGNRVADDPIRSGSAALILGLTSGTLAFLGASALLAQFGVAVGAAAGATLLVQMIARRRAPLGWTLPLVASVVAGLIGILSVFTGSLKWYCLLPTLAIPWMTRAVPANGRPVWLTAVWTSLVAMVPAVGAVLLAWFLDVSQVP